MFSEKLEAEIHQEETESPLDVLSKLVRGKTKTLLQVLFVFSRAPPPSVLQYLSSSQSYSSEFLLTSGAGM